MITEIKNEKTTNDIQTDVTEHDTNEEGNSMSEQYDGFLFLPSYMESYQAFVESGNQELADLLLKSIVVYGTEGKKQTDHPLIEAVMASIRRTIDSGRKKRKKALSMQFGQNLNKNKE